MIRTPFKVHAAIPTDLRDVAPRRRPSLTPEEIVRARIARMKDADVLADMLFGPIRSTTTNRRPRKDIR